MNSGSLISSIVKKIKGEMGSRTLCTWKGNCGEEVKEPLAIFVAHIDVSELPVKFCRKALPSFGRVWLPMGSALE